MDKYSFPQSLFKTMLKNWGKFFLNCGFVEIFKRFTHFSTKIRFLSTVFLTNQFGFLNTSLVCFLHILTAPTITITI